MYSVSNKKTPNTVLHYTSVRACMLHRAYKNMGKKWLFANIKIVLHNIDLTPQNFQVSSCPTMETEVFMLAQLNKEKKIPHIPSRPASRWPRRPTLQASSPFRGIERRRRRKRRRRKGRRKICLICKCSRALSLNMCGCGGVPHNMDMYYVCVV